MYTVKVGRRYKVRARHSYASFQHQGRTCTVLKVVKNEDVEDMGGDDDIRYSVDVKVDGVFQKEVLWWCEVVPVRRRKPRNEIEWLNRIQENFRDGG